MKSSKSSARETKIQKDENPAEPVEVAPLTRPACEPARDGRSGDETALRLLRDGLSVLPKAYGRAVRARDLACTFSADLHSEIDAGEPLVGFYLCCAPRGGWSSAQIG